jgi:xanthine dehydrogenase iron-sulfur cluster and FAD-binding subunit A
VLVKRRDGEATSTVLDWTKNDAVVTWEEKGADEATAKNVLGARVGGGEMAFLVNGVEVFRGSADGQHVNGVVGLRVNHGLNLHFSSLEVTGG